MRAIVSVFQEALGTEKKRVTAGVCSTYNERRQALGKDNKTERDRKSERRVRRERESKSKGNAMASHFCIFLMGSYLS